MGTEKRAYLFFPRRFRPPLVTLLTVVSLMVTDFRGEFDVLLSAAAGEVVSVCFATSSARPNG